MEDQLTSLLKWLGGSCKTPLSAEIWVASWDKMAGGWHLGTFGPGTLFNNFCHESTDRPSPPDTPLPVGSTTIDPARFFEVQEASFDDHPNLPLHQSGGCMWISCDCPKSCGLDSGKQLGTPSLGLSSVVCPAGCAAGWPSPPPSTRNLISFQLAVDSNLSDSRQVNCEGENPDEWAGIPSMYCSWVSDSKFWDSFRKAKSLGDCFTHWLGFLDTLVMSSLSGNGQLIKLVVLVDGSAGLEIIWLPLKHSKNGTFCCCCCRPVNSGVMWTMLGLALGCISNPCINSPFSRSVLITEEVVLILCCIGDRFCCFAKGVPRSKKPPSSKYLGNRTVVGITDLGSYCWWWGKIPEQSLGTGPPAAAPPPPPPPPPTTPRSHCFVANTRAWCRVAVLVLEKADPVLLLLLLTAWPKLRFVDKGQIWSLLMWWWSSCMGGPVNPFSSCWLVVLLVGVDPVLVLNASLDWSNAAWSDPCSTVLQLILAAALAAAVAAAAEFEPRLSCNHSVVSLMLNPVSASFLFEPPPAAAACLLEKSWYWSCCKLLLLQYSCIVVLNIMGLLQFLLLLLLSSSLWSLVALCSCIIICCCWYLILLITCRWSWDCSDPGSTSKLLLLMVAVAAATGPAELESLTVSCPFEEAAAAFSSQTCSCWSSLACSSGVCNLVLWWVSSSWSGFFVSCSSGSDAAGKKDCSTKFRLVWSSCSSCAEAAARLGFASCSSSVLLPAAPNWSTEFNVTSAPSCCWWSKSSSYSWAPSVLDLELSGSAIYWCSDVRSESPQSCGWSGVTLSSSWWEQEIRSNRNWSWLTSSRGVPKHPRFLVISTSSGPDSSLELEWSVFRAAVAAAEAEPTQLIFSWTATPAFRFFVGCRQQLPLNIWSCAAAIPVQVLWSEAAWFLFLAESSSKMSVFMSSASSSNFSTRALTRLFHALQLLMCRSFFLALWFFARHYTPPILPAAWNLWSWTPNTCSTGPYCSCPRSCCWFKDVVRFSGFMTTYGW